MKYSRQFSILKAGIISAGFASFLPIAISRADNFTVGANQTYPSAPQAWNNAVWQPGSMSPSSGNTYEALSGGYLQNPPNYSYYGYGAQTFPGDSLTLDSGSQLLLVGLWGTTAVFPGTNGNPGLILNGGVLLGNEGQTITIDGQISVVADSFFGHGLVIAAQISGSGNLILTDGNRNQPWDIRSSTNSYSGNWVVQGGYLKGTGNGSLGTGNLVIESGATLEIGYDIQTSGALTLSTGNSVMVLHQNCQFSAVTINGATLAPGAYTYAQLAAQFPGNFAGAGSGSITIPASDETVAAVKEAPTSDLVANAPAATDADADIADTTDSKEATSAVMAAADIMTAPDDTTAPTISSGVMVSAGSASQITIRWNGSTDPNGVGYNVYRNGVQIGTTTSTSYTDTGLLPSTTYCYTIIAYDGLGNSAAASAQACATTQIPPTPVTAEWYGPFASWANVKTQYGATGNGRVDDTVAVQAALTAVATGAGGATTPPSILYFPKGIYRISQTLTLLSREQFNIVADPGTRIVWAGAAGGTLFHLDGCDSGYFARLTFDGGGSAAIVFDHTKVNGTYFDADNVFEDCAFINGGTGMRGGAAGQGFASIMFRRCKFANCTVDGANVWNWNALDGYLVDCLFTNCNVGVHVYQGSLHPYRSLFVGNGTDIQLEQGVPFMSIVSNQSFNAGQFLYSPSIGQNGGEILVKDNLVVDNSATRPAVEMGVMGPLMFLDNTFANSGSTNAIRLFNSFAPDALAIGNQSTASLLGIESVWALPRTNMVDNTVVSRSSLDLTPMTLPNAATNLNRHIVEVSVNAGGSEIQSAIYSVTNWAGQSPVIHIPMGSHTISKTVVIPGGLDVTLVGDGWNDQMQWGSGPGQGPMFRLQSPARAGLQQFSATEFAKGDGIIFVEGANSVGSRVLLQDCNVGQAVSQNLWMDDCPNLTVEMDGDGHGDTMAGGSNGVSVEQTGRGKFRLFCADSGSNWRTYRSETNGEMYIETSWYEDHTADINFASFAGSGTVTFLSGKMASGGSGQDLSLDSLQINNWNGQFTLALMGVTDVVKLTGTGGGLVWFTGDTGSSLSNWFVNASSGLGFVATQNGNYQGGVNRIPDKGPVSAAFTRQMLTRARQEFMIGPVINPTRSAAADVRLIRINPVQGIRDIAIYAGTAP